MGEQLEIKVLVENTVNHEGLMAEHGLSFWFRYRENKYLFDTGQGLVLLHNANKMGIDLKELSGVFLSHGHNDHTGGLKDLMKINPEVNVYAHPEIFKQKYIQRNDQSRNNGIPLSKNEIKNFIPTKGVREVAKGIQVVSEVPPSNNFENRNNHFKIRTDRGMLIDDFKDEQVVSIEIEKGLVVLIGCSHVGIINILEQIKKLNMGKKIYAVIGGMHLLKAKDDRIKRTIRGLSEVDFELLMPLHCTGRQAVNEMLKVFNERIKIVNTGDRINL